MEDAAQRFIVDACIQLPVTIFLGSLSFIDRIGPKGFEEDIDYDVELAGGLRSMLFGGEGMFLATLEGHGKVWLQSLPFARLADRVLENAVHEERQDEDT